MLHMASINDAMAQLEAEAWEINCKRQPLQPEKNKLEEEAAKLKVQLEWNAKHKLEISHLTTSVSTLNGDVADMRNSLKGPVYVPASRSTSKDTPKTEKGHGCKR
jgi:chromosome segregation ATPase